MWLAIDQIWQTMKTSHNSQEDAHQIKRILFYRIVLLASSASLTLICLSEVSFTQTFIYFFLHKILCMQNWFKYRSVHMGNRARKRASMHIANNNMIQQ